MYTERAKKHHLPGINALLQKYGPVSVRPEMINHRDIGIVAMDDAGAVVGFTWLGLMAGNHLGYSEFSAADSAEIAREMNLALVASAKKCGVKMIYSAGYPPAALTDLSLALGVE